MALLKEDIVLLKEDIALLRKEMKEAMKAFELRLTTRLGAMTFAAVVIVAALVKLL